MMKKIGIILFSFLPILGFGQLFHFSQFDNAPIFINPANTGFYEGKYRLSTVYKSQWGSISSPYRTIFVAFDARIPVDGNNNNAIGVGANIISDKAGTTQLGLTNYNASVSYMMRLGEAQGISAGLSVGYLQQAINLDGMKWDSQYDGANYDPSIDPGEQDYSNRANYVDIAGGVVFLHQPYRRLRLEGGLSFGHLTNPNRSFNSVVDINEGFRYNFNAKAEIGLIKSYIPMLLVSKQKASYEIVAGGLRKITVGESSLYTNALTASAIYFGGAYRFKDGIIAQMMYEHKQQFKIGVSYDINLSKLRVATRKFGGVELTLSFIPSGKSDKIDVKNLDKVNKQ